MATGLVAGIGFITMAQSFSESFKSFGKKPIVIGIITAILAAATVYLAVSLIEDLFLLFWTMALIFLVFSTPIMATKTLGNPSQILLGKKLPKLV